MKMKCQGFTLIELILTLAVIAIISFLSFQSLNKDYENKQAAILGQQIKNIGSGVNNYIVNHYDVLSKLTNSTGSGLDSGPRTCNTTTQTCEITTQTLANEGMLPPVFSNQNIYGSGYKIIIARKGTAPYWNISSLITTDKPLLVSGAVRYDLLGKAMQGAGVDSGMTRALATKIDGYKGSWSATQTDYSNINNLGLLGFIAGYGSNSYSAFLRRDGTLPMTGDLNMGTKNIYGANNIIASGMVSVGGNLVVTGSSTLSGAVNANNTLTVAGASSLKGATVIGSTLNVAGISTLAGAVNANNTLTVAGTSTLTGAVTAKNAITASGNITSSEQIKGATLVSTGRTTVGEFVQLNGVATVGAACSPNGLQGRNTAGAILSCTNGVWSLVDSTPVGAIIAWGSQKIPDGWLELNGQSFDKAKNPMLASLYPSGSLPDFRGQFVRAWDHGAGVDPDSSRAILSKQGDAIRNITGEFKSSSGRYDSGLAKGVFHQKSSGLQGAGFSGWYEHGVVDFDVSRQVPTAAENRPKNISVMYIIKQG
ncbi:tail fiber protein [Citrobacter sp. wls714]|uniref:tail fiber protein n=1 Tax=Citrobacter sp. wls714 TaxID=2576422 RepID=UPI0010C98411|nr:tail fiber protein [Citrobacter sp. wls714]TKU51792.1 shufflon system plasmid conjugative transfer pilus tip adhesin PilV [Citrobacter sp. wls714]